jgi:hypothetical protein
LRGAVDVRMIEGMLDWFTTTHVLAVIGFVILWKLASNIEATVARFHDQLDDIIKLLRRVEPLADRALVMQQFDDERRARALPLKAQQVRDSLQRIGVDTTELDEAIRSKP